MAQQIQVSLGYKVETDSSDVQSGAVNIVDTTSATARIGGVRSVAPAANVEIPFDGAAASKMLVVRASGAINVRFGGAATDAVAVRPVAAGQEAVLMASVDASSIYIENPGTVSVSVSWLLAGV